MSGPAWDIESQYPSISSEKFQTQWQKITADLESMKSSIAEIKGELAKPTDKTIAQIQKILIANEDCMKMAANMATYLGCTLSVDSTHEEAKRKESEMQMFFSKLYQALMPIYMMVETCDEETFKKVLMNERLEGYRFSFEQSRLRAAHLLSETEESMMEGLSVSGHKAWGSLYTEVSGNMKVKLKYPDRTEEVGLAKASSLTRTANELDRKVAFLGIQEAWTEHQHTAAAVINALAGWRLENVQLRSKKKGMTFLDAPLQSNRITQKTLDAMITACRNNLPDIQKAPRLMAKVMKKPSLDLWDQLAPSPIAASSDLKSFEEGIAMVKNSFGDVSEEMADFVQMMVDKRWIEGRVLPNKRSGAYATGFPAVNEPRVYMTYMGSNSDIGTLAHELGHAFHSWVMRDMSLGEMNYPMTLAETASVFAETVLADALKKHAKTYEEKVEFAWSDVERASAFLINIPLRYDFEKRFYEARQARTLSANEVRKLMGETWTEWYGTSTSEVDDLFWASKMHFHFSGATFYNFPYTFGYLFSLSIYARRESLGAGFMDKYKAILRDTGRMTAEDLIMKHLGEDITQPAFWQKSIDVVKQKINEFEALVK